MGMMRVIAESTRIDVPTDTGLRRWFNLRGWSDITIATPYLWLLIFFLIPFLIVVAMSFATRTPTAPPFSFGGDYPLFNTENYARLFGDSLYLRAFLTSIKNAAFATVMFVSVQLALSVFSRGDYLFTPNAGPFPSDVANMATSLFLPYWFWGLVCGGFSLAVLAAGGWFFLRGARNVLGDAARVREALRRR